MTPEELVTKLLEQGWVVKTHPSARQMDVTPVGAESPKFAVTWGHVDNSLVVNLYHTTVSKHSKFDGVIDILKDTDPLAFCRHVSTTVMGDRLSCILCRKQWKIEELKP